jgi:hypothetical protein
MKRSGVQDQTTCFCIPLRFMQVTKSIISQVGRVQDVPDVHYHDLENLRATLGL